jgi:SAM-dependent methyltransferase
MNIIKKIARYSKTLALMYRAIDSFVHLPEIRDIDLLYQKYGSNTLRLSNSCALDLGCGAKPQNRFRADQVFGLDIREDRTQNISYADLTTDPIPFPENQFDYITAYDFLEHIPRVIYSPTRKFPFIDLMNEIDRVLKPGGIFLSRTPVYPISAAFTDPTHVNVITADTFSRYFDDRDTWAKIYGFQGGFKVCLQGIHETHLLTLIQKPK